MITLGLKSTKVDLELTFQNICWPDRFVNACNCRKYKDLRNTTIVSPHNFYGPSWI
ncbi:hypothetical protein [Methanobrevibacter ruminantium]|uniref:hypothetical protein n=1 Tax=Methanobrevibacter ruminantium TaxID=83816 RepID=UPI0026EDEE14|nr:hypothetical protein [Methanobrevibacter ruminantium]